MPRPRGYQQNQPLPRPPPKLLAPALPWTPGIIPDWDVLSTKTALNSHEQGLFQTSSQMAVAMGRDDRITAVIGTLVDGLLALPFNMAPADVTPGKIKARRIAETIEAHWESIAPVDELSAILWWFILLGVAPVQVTWTTVGDMWIPRLNAWDPQFLYWDQGDRVFKLNTQDGVIDLVPGDGDWMLLTAGDRGWMRGAIRSISTDWMSRQWVKRDWNRYNEKHGLPLTKVMVPSSSEQGEKSEFYRDMIQANSSGTVMLPQNVDGNQGAYDIELLEAKDRAWESFPGLEKSANKNIAVRILGQNLTTEVEGGSLAAANIHNLIRLDRLQSVANLLSCIIREQVLWPMVRFNFPDSEGFAPTPHWDTSPPADLVANGAGMKALGDGITAIKGAGFDLAPDTIEELGQEYNLKLVPTELDDDGPPEPPAPPTDGEATEDDEEDLEETG